MPVDEKKMTELDLGAIIEGLMKAGVDFILVGGLAAVIQGAPVTTLDVDIVHSQSDENIAKLLTFLKSIQAIYRRPDDKIIEPRKDDFSRMGHVLLSTRLGPLDILAYIEGRKTYGDLSEHAIEIEFRGQKIRVLDIRILTELKRLSKLPEDKQRLAVLEETLRQLAKTPGNH
jgi:hypothetical protein